MVQGLRFVQAVRRRPLSQDLPPPRPAGTWRQALAGWADTDRARDLLTAHEGISARDAIHAAVMINQQVEWIASFNAGFDRIPGIRRIDLD